MAYNPASFRRTVAITEEQIEELVNAEDWPYWESSSGTDADRKRDRREMILSGDYWRLRNESDYWGRKPVPPATAPPDDPDARRKAQLREEMQGRAARRRAARERRQRGT